MGATVFFFKTKFLFRKILLPGIFPIFSNIVYIFCLIFLLNLVIYFFINIFITGCPTKHDNSKTTWKSSLVFEFICDI